MSAPSLRLLIVVLALALSAPVAQAAPDDGAPLRIQGKKKKHRPAFGPKRRANKDKLRLDILDRIRCDSEDAATCFLEADFSQAAAERGARDAEIEDLLTEVLNGLQAHEGERIRAATAELEAEKAEEVGYFGASDHLIHPSTDLYEDPLKAYLDRPNLHLDQVDPRDFDYPIVLNARVQNWMVYFLTRGRSWFVKWQGRSERYKPLIIPALREAGLPEDLLYQSMIESGFNPYATSHASAVGIWQFIKSTGRGYGLNRDWWVDERRDPVMATRAAVDFMSDLYKRFGDWKLASAAYNAGGGKISRAIKMYGTQDFWELSADGNNYLKPETKNYVPKIMAAAILSKYAERYGLADEIKPEHRLSPWDHDIVQVTEATDLNLVADLAGTDLETLEGMNPALRRGYTPPGVQNYPLNLPKGSGKAFAHAFAKIPDDQRMTFVRYKVRRGDTLGRIAGNYSVPVAAVQRMNGIRDARKMKVGQTLLIPVRSAELGARTITHIVARGESLSLIARKYEATAQGIRDLNQLETDTLTVGQRLKVTTKGGEVQVASTEKAKTRTAARSTNSHYKVRSGDSLYVIATAHGTTVDELRKLNRLTSQSVIHPGDSLRVSAAEPEPTTTAYAVRSGDTLSGIAARHGMRTADLKELNKLKSDSLKVGQKLEVTGGGAAASVSHKVESGDSLYGIASRYSVSVDAIKRSNDLSGNTIRPGQLLKIPASGKAGGEPKTIAYQVRSGDTLSAISQKYGVTVGQLKSWNQLRNDAIRPGQKLRVKLQ